MDGNGRKGVDENNWGNSSVGRGGQRGSSPKPRSMALIDPRLLACLGILFHESSNLHDSHHRFVREQQQGLSSMLQHGVEGADDRYKQDKVRHNDAHDKTGLRDVKGLDVARLARKNGVFAEGVCGFQSVHEVKRHQLHVLPFLLLKPGLHP